MTVRDRWDPKDHPRNPRNGRFVENRLGGWVSAASAQLGERATAETESEWGGLKLHTMDWVTPQPQLYQQFYREIATSNPEYKRITLRNMAPGYLVQIKDPNTGRVPWAYTTGVFWNSGRLDHITAMMPDGRRVQIRSDSGGQETVNIKRKLVYDPLGVPSEEKSKQLNRWRRDANQPGRVYQTNREVNQPRFRRELEQAQERIDGLNRQLENDTREFSGLADRLGFRGQRKEQYISDNLQEIHERIKQAERDVNLARQAIDYNWHADDPALDEISPYASARLDETLYNPDRPLAVYGDMLQIGGGQATYDHLQQLSQIPAELHRVVARRMARRDDGGIVVGAKSVQQLGFDSNTGPSGSWGPGKTWDDVDGVHIPGKFYVGYTANTRNAGVSAAAHEFGHALDETLGPGIDYESESSPEWKPLWRSVINSGLTLNPHFTQNPPAGYRELWAETFHLYATNNSRNARVDAIKEKLLHVTPSAGPGNPATRLANQMVDYFDRIIERTRTEGGN